MLRRNTPPVMKRPRRISAGRRAPTGHLGLVPVLLARVGFLAHAGATRRPRRSRRSSRAPGEHELPGEGEHLSYRKRGSVQRMRIWKLHTTKTLARNTASCVTTTAPCAGRAPSRPGRRSPRPHIREVVAAEEECREEGADDGDLDELREHEEAHLHGAVLGVVAAMSSDSASGRSKGCACSPRWPPP